MFKLIIIFLFSIILKGIGSILEILIQVLFTRFWGVDNYGTYSTLINVSELIYFTLFSGIIKCNTFYLAENGTTIKSFKEKYYKYYLVPVISLAIGITILCRNTIICLVLIIALAQYMLQNMSSMMMARKSQGKALVGEYVLGRAVFLLMILIAFQLKALTLTTVLLMYLGQYVLVILYFLFQSSIYANYVTNKTVSVHKLLNYQRADIIQSVITNLPVIIQYLFTDSFDAGVVSIILLVKKLINFISGPTAKVFLPEYSRLYKERDIKGLCSCHASIMKIQMLFVAPMTVALIGFPSVLLSIFSEKLISYTWYFQISAAVFLVAATLGPCGGLMQMTGNERYDNALRELALLAAAIIFVVMHKSRYFVLFGIIIQTSIESIGKYIFICLWMKDAPVTFLEYMEYWILPCLVVIMIYFLSWNQSAMMMFLTVMCVFLIKLYSLLIKGRMIDDIRRLLKNK